jgi:transcription antitermination factor NusA-like protein
MSLDLVALLKTVAIRRGVAAEQLVPTASRVLSQLAQKHYGDRHLWEPSFDLERGEAVLMVLLACTAQVRDRCRELTVAEFAALDVEVEEGDELSLTVLSFPPQTNSPTVEAILALASVPPGRAQAFERDLEQEFERALSGPAPVAKAALTLEDTIRAAFAAEVPELRDRTVEIVGVAFDHGTGRCKIAVRSRNFDIDPVGALVGLKGQRIIPVLHVLLPLGISLDLVQWSSDPLRFVASAARPLRAGRMVVDNQLRRVEFLDPTYEFDPAKEPTEEARREGVRANLRLVEQLTGYVVVLGGEPRFEAPPRPV